MRRRIIPVVMCLMLLMSVSAQAVTTRAIQGAPRLSFSGTTVTCEVDLRSGNSSDKFSATLTLYQGSTEIDSWDISGTGRVTLSKNCGVTKNKTYTLTLTYSVNGTTQPSVSVDGTCK